MFEFLCLEFFVLLKVNLLFRKQILLYMLNTCLSGAQISMSYCILHFKFAIHKYCTCILKSMKHYFVFPYCTIKNFVSITSKHASRIYHNIQIYLHSPSVICNIDILFLWYQIIFLFQLIWFYDLFENHFHIIFVIKISEVYLRCKGIDSIYKFNNGCDFGYVDHDDFGCENQNAGDGGDL